jgi:hypothetical protein
MVDKVLAPWQLRRILGLAKQALGEHERTADPLVQDIDELLSALSDTTVVRITIVEGAHHGHDTR